MALLAAATAGTILAGTAAADPIATVKAKTQRMSEPNLNSHQNGWYSPGDHLDLVCSKHGQGVKGFFSFNIPGGWDNLWYKTSDGNYVADVDIETGTLKDVTPECGPDGPNAAAPPAPAPAPSGDRGQQALAWARNHMAADPYDPVECEVFVEQAYNHAFRYLTAKDDFNDRRAKGEIHTNADGIPAGALVFTSDPTYDFGNGHVMLSQGDGTYLTANYYTDPRHPGPKIRVVPLDSGDPHSQFLGWAEVP